MSSRVEAVHVVIPAHQEADHLERQLAAVLRASRHVTARGNRVRTSVTVVLDDCDDGSAQVVAAFPGVSAVVVRMRCVGAARARGVDRARGNGWSRPDGTWIANTDADSEVPVDWLTTQLELAGHGADLVLGTVRPDHPDVSSETYRRWATRHRLDDGHPHVHGANLGVRLSAYDAVGGFPALRVGEDVELARLVAESGRPVVRTARAPVLTSARLRGRVEDGFASYLTAL